MSEKSKSSVLSNRGQASQGLYLTEKFLRETMGLGLDECLATLPDNPGKIEAAARALAQGVVTTIFGSSRIIVASS